MLHISIDKATKLVSMTNEDNSLFENNSFNPFSCESILLNKNQDPDENLFEIF